MADELPVVVRHRKGNRVVIVNQDYLEICDDDTCAAMVLAALEFEHRKAKDHKTPGLITRLSYDDVVKRILFRYEKARVGKAIQFLRDKGFIVSVESPHSWDRTRYYRLNVKAIEDAFKPCTEDEDSIDCAVGDAEGIDQEIGDASPTENAPEKLSRGFSYKERYSSYPNSSNTLPPNPQTPTEAPNPKTFPSARQGFEVFKNSTVEDPTTTEQSTELQDSDPSPIPRTPSPLADVDSGEYADSSYVVAAWNRHRGFKKLNGTDKRFVEESWPEGERTEPEVDAALDGFYNSDYGKQNKYPIRALLKHFDSWREQGQDETDSARPAIYDRLPANTTRGIPPNAPTASKRDFVAEWNAAVKAAPQVTSDIRRNKIFQQAEADPEFADRFADLVSGMEAIHAGSDDFKKGYMDFTWLMKKEFGREPNWKVFLSRQPKTKESKTDDYSPDAIEARILEKRRLRRLQEQEDAK